MHSKLKNIRHILLDKRVPFGLVIFKKVKAFMYEIQPFTGSFQPIGEND
jgi:hypothetical protein